MNDNTENLMSRAQYARHRGVDASTVTGYGHKGYLVEVGGKIDAAATDELLDAMLDPLHGGDRRPTGAGGGDQGTVPRPASGKVAYLEAKTQREITMAQKAQIELEKEAGRLVYVDEVAAEAFAVARQAQEALLNLPDRLASILAAETDPERIYVILTKEISRVVGDIVGDEA